jgi:hypothetical protein
LESYFCKGDPTIVTSQHSGDIFPSPKAIPPQRGCYEKLQIPKEPDLPFIVCDFKGHRAAWGSTAHRWCAQCFSSYRHQENRAKNQDFSNRKSAASEINVPKGI